jgi:hypothetical protein
MTGELYEYNEKIQQCYTALEEFDNELENYAAESMFTPIDENMEPETKLPLIGYGRVGGWPHMRGLRTCDDMHNYFVDQEHENKHFSILDLGPKHKSTEVNYKKLLDAYEFFVKKGLWDLHTGKFRDIYDEDETEDSDDDYCWDNDSNEDNDPMKLNTPSWFANAPCT